MQIQSLSIVVPNRACMNNCKFCVSRMHNDRFPNLMDDASPFFDLYLKDYLKRLEFAKDNGCNTIMLTGTSEPQQNKKYLTYFGMFMQLMRNPFRWIEMQTTGAGLDRNYLRFLRNHVGVNLISLSISSLNDDENNDIIGTPKDICLDWLCQSIKEYGFSLRLSLNLTSCFDKYRDNPGELFATCHEFGADQITLRVLYTASDFTEQDKWVMAHTAKSDTIAALQRYIINNGRLLGTLPYGARKYSVDGMSVVIDADCIAKDADKKAEAQEIYKYLILQPNCKLYSQWDDPASLIF